jgi:hypothetical protein
VFVAAMVAPIGYALYLSLWTERSSGLGFGGAHQVFDGIGNYSRALGDSAFRHGFLITAGYCALYIPVMLCLALGLALLLDSALARARRFFQLALFLPHAVPGLIAALVWTYLYTPGISPVVSALNSGGIHIDFLSSSVILPSVVNIAVWEWTGYNMVVFYAALQAVPREVIEAARTGVDRSVHGHRLAAAVHRADDPADQLERDRQYLDAQHVCLQRRVQPRRLRARGRRVGGAGRRRRRPVLRRDSAVRAAVHASASRERARRMRELTA